MKYELKHYTSEDLEKITKKRADAFDKWAWKTGTDADRDEFEALDNELRNAISASQFNLDYEVIINEMVKTMTKTVDKSILDDLSIKSTKNNA